MKKILQKIYNGDIVPSEWIIPRTKEYWQARDREIELTKELRKDFTIEQKKLYNKAEEQHSEVYGMEIELTFVEAFKLGARIVMECFEEHRPPSLSTDVESVGGVNNE